MSVGNQANSGDINQKLSAYALALRDLMESIADLNKFVNGQGTGLATLEALGYVEADATAALSMLSYLNTVAAVYYGTATQATTFDFDNELSQLWAAQ